MNPAIATYYPIAILLAVAAAVVIPLYLASARRWSGFAVVGNDSTALRPTPVINNVSARHSAPRLVAISSSAKPSGGPTRSISRQAMPNRVRALEGVVSTRSHDLTGLASNLAARRPGLLKGSARSDRRLAVVR